MGGSSFVLLPSLVGVMGCFGLLFAHGRSGALAATTVFAQAVIHAVILARVAPASRVAVAGALFVAAAAGVSGAVRSCRERPPERIDDLLGRAVHRVGAGTILGLGLALGPQPLRAFGWALAFGVMFSLALTEFLAPLLVNRWRSTSDT